MRKIVTIGGGTGTFVVLSGLKKKPDVELSAIVSVYDSGGSTGRLRDAYGHLPPGDVRQALIALSEDESVLRSLFIHRFGKGDVAGHSFGNLFLTALSEILGSETQAYEEAARLLRIRGRVIPVSHTPGILCAEFADGFCAEGEHMISALRESKGAIARLYLKSPCTASRDAIDAIEAADLVVLGPGDIFTSTLANFVTDGLPAALTRSRAHFVYVMNLFSSPESGGMTMKNYIETVTHYVGRPPDTVLINTSTPTQEVVAHYVRKGQHRIVDDLDSSIHTVRADLLSDREVELHAHDSVDRSLIRHDGDKLADVLMSL